MAIDQQARTGPRFGSATRVMAVAGLIGLVVTAAVVPGRRGASIATPSTGSCRADPAGGQRGRVGDRRYPRPLETAVDIAAATDGSPQQFASFMSAYIGCSGLFVSASLWRTTGGSPVPVASTGASPAMPPTSTGAQAFVEKAVSSSMFVVTSISTPGLQRIAYALANPTKSSYVVYAERAIPANRRVPVESNSAFADLYYATYFGSTTDSSALETTGRRPQPPAVVGQHRAGDDSVRRLEPHPGDRPDRTSRWCVRGSASVDPRSGRHHLDHCRSFSRRAVGAAPNRRGDGRAHD